MEGVECLVKVSSVRRESPIGPSSASGKEQRNVWHAKCFPTQGQAIGVGNQSHKEKEDYEIV